MIESKNMILNFIEFIIPPIKHIYIVILIAYDCQDFRYYLYHLNFGNLAALTSSRRFLKEITGAS